MKHIEETSCSAGQAIDLILAVKELNGRSSHELNKLLKGSENFVVQYVNEKGYLVKIDMEKVVAFLPLHLMAVLVSSERNETTFRYLLCGIRLLHSLFELAPRHTKLEQILLEDMRVLEQLLDFIFYMLIVLASYRQEAHSLGLMSLVHSALVACSLYLLTGFISSQWQDLVHVLLTHQKVDIFMDAAFASVRKVVRCLEMTLSTFFGELSARTSLSAEQILSFLFQQCEASLQFLHSLCQQKVFRERLLKNKELCGKGGVLFLAQSILKLKFPPPFLESSKLMSAASRLKAKTLSILLILCEAESVSYLDEVASSSQSLNLAKSVALEVLELLKTAFGTNPRQPTASGAKYPSGFVQLNAIRLADIFSDDSNFRSYITSCFTKVLTAIFSLSHGDFLHCWCSSTLPEREEDATLEYDLFAASGWVMDNASSLDLLSATNLEFTLNPTSMPQASYAHQRTALFVKVVANLHCFVPSICEEQERNLFLLKVHDCLQMDLSILLPGFSFTSDATRASTVCKNLRSLLSHAESLIPNFLNEEDVHLLRVFLNQLQLLFNAAEMGENHGQGSKCEESLSWNKFSKLNISEKHQEAQSIRQCSPPSRRREPLYKRRINMKEGMSENSASFQEVDQLCTRAEEIDLGDDVKGQNLRDDKVILSNIAPEVAKDINRDIQNVDTSGSDTSSAKGKNVPDHADNRELFKSGQIAKVGDFGENPEDDRVETVQRRKRKRTIMNDNQITLIERALLDEPEMQRNAALIQSWADKLSLYGSEVTCAQLKNWINNRKARLARTANKDIRPTPEADNSAPDKQRVTVLVPYDSPESTGDGACVSSNATKEQQSISGTVEIREPRPAELVKIGPPEFVQCKPGQYVVLVDKQGEEIGKGKVHQVQGNWLGKNLEELEACVVDINDLKAERGTRLPYASEATGISFEEAETKFGVMRVLWDSNRIYMLTPHLK